MQSCSKKGIACVKIIAEFPWESMCSTYRSDLRNMTSTITSIPLYEEYSGLWILQIKLNAMSHNRNTFETNEKCK